MKTLLTFSLSVSSFLPLTLTVLAASEALWNPVWESGLLDHSLPLNFTKNALLFLRTPQITSCDGAKSSTIGFLGFYSFTGSGFFVGVEASPLEAFPYLPLGLLGVFGLAGIILIVNK